MGRPIGSRQARDRLRIKSLQITGFKSFVDKTAFTFKYEGVTGIVGPNGCGKSNVVDAIRWCMGEQSPRRLRGKGMDDVIFAGSEVRAPVGMAEVILRFDNADGLAPPQFAAFAEIQVARRLYRSGESEYLLNKTPCRLRDVHDFFRDTGIGTKGYTIVEQGSIALLVSAKPEERRGLIEEAAGISKYKARRRESERKLAATEQNLVRVTDVLGEIKRQISSLERQAKKAARYKRLRALQRILELSLAADERQELLGGLEQARGRLGSLHDAVSGAEVRLAEKEAALEQRRLDLAERERALTQGNEVLFQLRGQIKELESQIAYERRERASLAEMAEARRTEREQLVGQLAASREEEARLADELQALEAALAEEGEAMRGAEAEASQAGQALRALEQRRETQSQELVGVLTRIARSEDRSAALEDRHADLDRRLRSADEQLSVQRNEAAQVDREQERLEEGLRNLLGERDRLMGLVREAITHHERTLEQARDSAEALRGRRELRETRRARLASLQEILERSEDLGAGARHLLQLSEAERGALGVRGLVRDLLDVDPEAERAVEAVLADLAEGLVVAGGEEAVQALSALRGAQAGRGVFVLQRPAPEEPQGFVPLGEPLLSRVRPRRGFESLAHSLLAGVNLVEDLGEALALYGQGRIPATFVTRSGDVLSPDGVIRGGGEAAQSGILTRVREARELEAEVAALDQEVLKLGRAQRASEQGLASAQDDLENLRNRHHTAALAVANHEKDLERTRERVKALGEAHEGRVAERSEYLSEVDSTEQERTRLESVLMEARDERLRRQRDLDALGLEIGSAGRELSRLENVVTERRVQHGSRQEVCERLRAGLERSRASAEETGLWIQRREAEIHTSEVRREELARSTQQAEVSLAERLREEEGARASSEAKRDAYEEQAAAVRDLEEAARAVRIDLESQRDETQQAELGMREMELGLRHLEESVGDRWSVDLATWKPPAPALDPESEPVAVSEVSEDPGEVHGQDARREAREIAELVALDGDGRRERLGQMRKRIEAIGEVNLGAIEEHEELRERFRFLGEQKADLETSVAQLRDAISRINRTSRKRFRETFEAINAKFQKNFPRLFSGGKAALSLDDGEDVLEAGIEITVQPPGKRLQSVDLLSGGEKTMTAIALLVSIFQVKPSPFFLLDEVDAALDDANVGRFNEIVEEMSRNSQFLVITHNKRTIEVSELLYGVTMEEKGVSKLVSVELH